MAVLAEHGSGSGSVESVGNVGIDGEQPRAQVPLEQNAGPECEGGRWGKMGRWGDGGRGTIGGGAR